MTLSLYWLLLRDQLVGVWIPTAHETAFQGTGSTISLAPIRQV